VVLGALFFAHFASFAVKEKLFALILPSLIRPACNDLSPPLTHRPARPTNRHVVF
jgi:hypothetical protein